MAESIFRTAKEGWRIGLRSVIVMPYLSGSAFLLFLLCLVVDSALRGEPFSQPQVSLNVMLVLMVRLIAMIAIDASVLSAVYRFALLGEVADRPVWSLPPMYSRLVAWLLLLKLGLQFLLGPAIAVLSMIGIAVLIYPGRSHPLLMAFVVLAVVTIGLIITVIVGLRLMLLLPAIALATPAAAWRNAWNDSRGHAWKILGAQVAACLPVVAVGAVVSFWLFGLRSPEGVWRVLPAIAELLMCYISGTVTARLYWLYGASLSR